MQFARFITVVLGVWLVSSVAFSRGSSAPELPVVEQARATSAEYPLLHQLQDSTLELQLFEIALKNRRDPQTEEKITAALKSIDADGQILESKFRVLRQTQLDEFKMWLMRGRRFSTVMGIDPKAWDQSLEEFSSVSKVFTVSDRRKNILNVAQVEPVQLGNQVVWHVGLAEKDQESFWVRLHRRGRDIGLETPRNLILVDALGPVNKPYDEAVRLQREYVAQSYAKLYGAFEAHRFAIFQRVTTARRALERLAHTNTAMSVPESLATLYNQTLENLFLYGVDVSLSGLRRDFALKGFLFVDAPEKAQSLLERLKFSPAEAAGNYNSPSS